MNTAASNSMEAKESKVLIPCKLQQPFEPVEWVYPNDGESEFYTYEQMMNDWVPSDVEDDESSDDEEYEDRCEYEDDEYW